MQTYSKNNIRTVITGLIVSTLLTACAEWNAASVVVDQQYGQSVRNMIKNQILYPEHGQNDKPVLAMDGQKAQGIVNDYRDSNSAKLERAKTSTFLPINSIGGGN